MDHPSNQLSLDLNEEPDGLTLAETEGDNWLYDLFVATVCNSDTIDSMEEKICILCNKSFTELGNNPSPLASSGQCCDKCNEKVILARILDIKKGDEAEASPPSQ